MGSLHRSFPSQSHGWATRSIVVAEALALLLPSLWLLLALVVPEGGAKAWSRALFYLAILLTMAGTPTSLRCSFG